MRRVVSISVAGLAVILSTGCVRQASHDTVLQTARAREDSILRLEADLTSANTNLETARGEIVALQGQIDDLLTLVDSEQVQQDNLLREVASLSALPIDLNLALEQFAGTYPDLISFESRRGLLRFSSDFTFDSGSAVLRREAAAMIAQLAPILNDTQAERFEIHLIGHTDAVPIAKPSTRRAHPTNVHLSVHRAISVRNALRDAGVEPGRMLAAGYGEHRPLVPNGAKGQAAENRRVEMRLVPIVRAAPTSGRATPIQSYPEIPSK